MSRFVLITPNTDFDARVRQALAGGLPGGLQTFAFVNPAEPRRSSSPTSTRNAPRC